MFWASMLDHPSGVPEDVLAPFVVLLPLPGCQTVVPETGYRVQTDRHLTAARLGTGCSGVANVTVTYGCLGGRRVHIEAVGCRPIDT